MTHHKASKPRSVRTGDAIAKTLGYRTEPSTDKARDYGHVILLTLVLALAAAELANITGLPPTTYDVTQALMAP